MQPLACTLHLLHVTFQSYGFPGVVIRVVDQMEEKHAMDWLMDDEMMRQWKEVLVKMKRMLRCRTVKAGNSEGTTCTRTGCLSNTHEGKGCRRGENEEERRKKKEERRKKKERKKKEEKKEERRKKKKKKKKIGPQKCRRKVANREDFEDTEENGEASARMATMMCG